MVITYLRPETLDTDELDPGAPAPDLSPTGTECGTVTFDTDGAEWRCTRAPHPHQHEHRAAYDRDGAGPEGAVAIAWTYQYATEDDDEQIKPAAPARTLTIALTFPARAANGINTDTVAAAMITAALEHFWEGDHDDIRTTITTR